MNLIGRYELLEQLDEGSMGMVYRAKDPVLDREVVLKTLSTAGVQDSELLERFYREARACARLRHPNIVSVYDFGQEKGIAYIAMELLKGSDLKRIISSRKAISLEQKLQIMASVCDGLQHAHSMGIVHRDIKPSNIFLDTDSQPHILDFGVAHIATSSLTMTGHVLGTPYYMSPEQILGHACGQHSDIFSSGIVAFEFVTGKHPFGESPVKRIVEGNPDSLLALNPDVPVELEGLLRRALARDPAARYASAAEFSLALRQVAGRIKNQPATRQVTTMEQTRSVAPGTETILSAVLINLQKFEDAADRGDLVVARDAMAEMKRTGSQDSRFAVALEQSAKRLAELENQFAGKAPEERRGHGFPCRQTEKELVHPLGGTCQPVTVVRVPQEAVVPRPEQPSSRPEPVPAAISGTETVLSVVLINLQKFEDAADRGDLGVARHAMAEMKRVGSQDSRFAVALEQSAKRLAELESQFAASTPLEAVVPPPEEPSSRPEPVPASQTRTPVPRAAGSWDATALFGASAPHTVTEGNENLARWAPSGHFPAVPRLVSAPDSTQSSRTRRDEDDIAPRRSYLYWALPLCLLVCGAVAASLWLLRTTQAGRFHPHPVPAAEQTAAPQSGIPAAPPIALPSETVSPAIEPAPVSHRVESPERKSISLVQKQKHKPSAPQVMSLDNTGQLKRAETFWMMGEYDKSSALLQRVLSTHPDSAAAADLLKKVQRAKQAEGN